MNELAQYRPKRLHIPVLFILAALLTQGLGATPLSAAPLPTLHVTAPARVDVGAPIELTLTVRNATDIAGYETHLLFDHTAAHFSGLHQRKNDLKKLGRDISPLEISELPDGIAIGFYSCSTPDCVTGRGQKRQGGNGKLVLARVVLGTDRAGLLTLTLDGTRLVDAAGTSLMVDIPTRSFTVQVGPAGGPAYRAPTPRWQLMPTAPVSQPGPFDLTGDGRVSHADAMEVALAWTTARENSRPCGVLADATRDINHDGCIDVADLQLVAANYSPDSVQPASIERTTLSSASSASSDAASITASADTTPFVVNTNVDAEDTNIGDGICRASVATTGKCTLRSAISEANAHSGPDTITFAIPGSGIQTIRIAYRLRTLADASGPTTIDGYTQPGASPNTDALASNAAIRVQIEGVGTSEDVLAVTSAGNVIRGLAFYKCKRCLWVYGSGASNNAILGNFIGTDATGTFASPETSGSIGVQVNSGAARNRIGGEVVADRNVVSGNSSYGIATYYEAANYNVIINNIIGLSPDGTRRLSNKKHGVDINSQSSYNVVGGTEPGKRNVVSGNGENGVEVSHDTLTVGNQVVGNYIGTGLTGTSAGAAFAYNAQRGVMVEDGASNTLVAQNVIGNGRFGGIEVFSYNTIANVIRNNRIGIGVDDSPIGNMNAGVLVKYYAGRTQIGPGNMIANNAVGVMIDYVNEDFNTITQNSIFNNTSMGIDLAPQLGVSYNDANDTDTGANEGLNYPVLTGATSYQVSGTACAEAVVPKPCTVEVFVAERSGTDKGAGNYGQGKTFVGSGSTRADGQFTVAVSGVSVGDYVTATATDADGNSSEFSYNRVVVNATVPSPTSTPTPSPGGSTTYAADAFNRQVQDGWGSANVGGGWALEAPARPAVDYDVTGAAGTINMTTANIWRSGYLPSVQALDVDGSFRVAVDKQMSGGFGFVYFVARRVAVNTQYFGRVSFDAAGNIVLQAGKNDGSGTTLEMLGAPVSVQGVRQLSNSFLQVRAQVFGTNPTTIRVKVWNDGQPEPASWQYSVTDGTPVLQAPGAIGLRAYMSSGVTTTPVRFHFDDLLVREMSSSVPSTPTETVTPSSTPTASPTATQTTEPTSPVTETPSPTPTRTATSDAQAYVEDTFSRTENGSWGSTTLGGSYTLVGTAADFSVSGSSGLMNLSSPNANRAASLASVSAQDVEGLVQITNEKSPANGSFIAYMLLRRVNSGTHYRARVRYASDGRVMLLAERYVNGTQMLLGGERVVSGVSVTGQTTLWLRVQAVGANPTTLRMKAWSVNQAEPAAWTYSVTDSTPDLQTSGAVGLAGYLASNATSAPMSFAFDNFGVRQTSP